MSVRSVYIGAPTFTLPTAVGSATQVLTSNGDGSTEWAPGGGGGGGVSEIKAGVNITLSGTPTVVTVNMPILPDTGPLAGQVVGFSGAPGPAAPLAWVDQSPTSIGGADYVFISGSPGAQTVELNIASPAAGTAGQLLTCDVDTTKLVWADPYTAGDNITISAGNVVAMPIAGTQTAGYVVGFGGVDDALTWVEPTQPIATVAQPTLVIAAGVNFGLPSSSNISTLTLGNVITIIPGTASNNATCSTATNDFLITYTGFITSGASYIGNQLYMGMVWNATQLVPIFGTWSFAGTILSFQSFDIAIAENDVIEVYPPQLSYTTN
jgi:hypothetical protein